VLVTHDRYMLDRVSNIVLGLDVRAARRASPTMRNGKRGRRSASRDESDGRCVVLWPRSSEAQPPGKKKLSYLERGSTPSSSSALRTRAVGAKQKRRLGDPAIASDSARLVAAHAANECRKKNWTHSTPAGRNWKESRRRDGFHSVTSSMIGLGQRVFRRS